MNMLRGHRARAAATPSACALDGGVHLPLPGRDVALPDGAPLAVGIRPEHVELGPGPLELTVGTTEMLGSETIVHAADRRRRSPSPSPAAASAAPAPATASGSALPDPFVHLFDAAGASVAAPADWQSAYPLQLGLSDARASGPDP